MHLLMCADNAKLGWYLAKEPAPAKIPLFLLMPKESVSSVMSRGASSVLEGVLILARNV